jgi:putative nucleotidyltransferase with HDIG domain
MPAGDVGCVLDALTARFVGVEQVAREERATRLKRARTLAAVRELAAAVDAKDPSTQRHSERVAELSARLASSAGWAADRVVLLREAALVHDVGKITIPNQLLLKSDRLTDAEYELVKPHSAVGAQMLTDLLSPEQVDWIRHHHERFDGSGYPDQLAGRGIPQGARLLSVADAWDAMTVARCYGAPRPIDDAIGEMQRLASTQFCPDAAALLLDLYNHGTLELLGVARPDAGTGIR